VLDAERGTGRNVDSLARNLDLETLAGFDGIREPPELRRELIRKADSRRTGGTELTLWPIAELEMRMVASFG